MCLFVLQTVKFLILTYLYYFKINIKYVIIQYVNAKPKYTTMLYNSMY
jgi:hypothetical protein